MEDAYGDFEVLDIVLGFSREDAMNGIASPAITQDLMDAMFATIKQFVEAIPEEEDDPDEISMIESWNQGFFENQSLGFTSMGPISTQDLTLHWEEGGFCHVLSLPMLDLLEHAEYFSREVSALVAFTYYGGMELYENTIEQQEEGFLALIEGVNLDVAIEE